VADHLAQDELHALAIARDIVAGLNLPPSPAAASSGATQPPWREPLYPAEELRGLVPADGRQSWDVRGVLACVLDGSCFDEFKQNYGRTLVTGARVAGSPGLLQGSLPAGQAHHRLTAGRAWWRACHPSTR
jgi:3-methylcrotonyl-CoA carboxylase beta subunit